MDDFLLSKGGSGSGFCFKGDSILGRGVGTTSSRGEGESPGDCRLLGNGGSSKEHEVSG